MQFFFKQNENTVLFFCSHVYFCYSHQSVNRSIAGVYFPRQWHADTVDSWSWSWSGKSHQYQACNFILLSGMLLLSHNAKERLEKNNIKWKSPSSILKMEIETRLTTEWIIVQNLCKLYEHEDGESHCKYNLHCEELLHGQFSNSTGVRIIRL